MLSDIEKEALAFAVCITAYVLLLNLLFGYSDVWGSFYTRHAQMTFERGTTLYFDELSYLGRWFTYPPAFFEFGASIARITDALFCTDYMAMHNWLHILSVFFFAASTYALFFKYGRRERILASLIFLSECFVPMTATAISLHIIALTLLNIGIIFIDKRRVISTISISLAFAFHPLTAFLFPFFLYAYRRFEIKKEEIVTYAYILIPALLLSSIFMLPIILRYGMPNEIVPTRWGYLSTYGFNGMQYQFQFLIPLIIACAYGFLTKYRIQTALLLLLVLIYAYISFRVDIALTLLLASLFPSIFQDYIRSKYVWLAVMLFPLGNFVFIPIIYSGSTHWCVWGVANHMCLSPMRFINENTPSESRLAINPIYSHIETLFGRRPVLADLYVEYADEEKFLAQDYFYNSTNISVLEKYNITLFVLDDISYDWREGTYKKRFLPIEEADRVYDNGFIHVFRKRYG
ncbi:MAG: hypothetical protein QXP42_02925 [Candidatus Micrarchaeia archaeon]